MISQELQDLLDVVEISRDSTAVARQWSRKRAWNNLQEVRWILKVYSRLSFPQRYGIAATTIK
jgi:hypothetical protein